MLNRCRRVTRASLNLGTGRPADPDQRVDQCAASDPECPADRRLAGPPVECRDDGGKLRRIDGNRTPATTTAAAGGSQPRLYSFLDERPLELRECPEDME